MPLMYSVNLISLYLSVFLSSKSAMLSANFGLCFALFTAFSVIFCGAFPACSSKTWLDLATHREGEKILTNYTCEGGTPKLFPSQICNGIRNCFNGTDEECVELAGDVKVTDSGRMDDHVIVGGTVYLKWPQYRCQTPVCHSTYNTALMAHLVCRQNLFETFTEYGSVPRGNNTDPAISPGRLFCSGQERTVQDCMFRDSRVLLSTTCPRLLTVSCTNKCRFTIYNATSGSVASPGYPKYVFPNLQCQWYLDTGDPTIGIVVQFLDLNLYELNRADFEDNKLMEIDQQHFSMTTTRRHSSSVQKSGQKHSSQTGRWNRRNLTEEEKWNEMKCRNSFVGLALGRTRAPDGTVGSKWRKCCGKKIVLDNLTSTESSIHIIFKSGPFLGQLTGNKGFLLRYSAVPAEELEDFFPVDNDDSSNMTIVTVMMHVPFPWPIALGILLAVLLFAALIVCRCHIRNKKWNRALMLGTKPSRRKSRLCGRDFWVRLFSLHAVFGTEKRSNREVWSPASDLNTWDSDSRIDFSGTYFEDPVFISENEIHLDESGYVIPNNCPICPKKSRCRHRFVVGDPLQDCLGPSYLRPVTSEFTVDHRDRPLPPIPRMEFSNDRDRFQRRRQKKIVRFQTETSLRPRQRQRQMESNLKPLNNLKKQLSSGRLYESIRFNNNVTEGKQEENIELDLKAITDQNGSVSLTNILIDSERKPLYTAITAIVHNPPDRSSEGKHIYTAIVHSTSDRSFCYEKSPCSSPEVSVSVPPSTTVTDKNGLDVTERDFNMNLRPERDTGKTSTPVDDFQFFSCDMS